MKYHHRLVSMRAVSCMVQTFALCRACDALVANELIAWRFEMDSYYAQLSIYALITQELRYAR